MTKYGAIPSEFAGVKYRSRLEARYAGRLAILKRAGQVEEWAKNVDSFTLTVEGRAIGRYTPDFVVADRGHEAHYVETKGGPGSRDWQLRAKLFLALYPALTLVIARASGDGFTHQDAREFFWPERRKR